METVLRVTIVYLVIVAGLRVLGKREFAQLSPAELVSLMMVPEIVQQALVRDDFSLVNALIGVTTLFVLVFGTSLITHRFASLKTVVTGKPALLVARGKMIEEALNHERITPDEVLAEVRRSGLERLEQVKWAVLEGDGKISVVPEGSAERSLPTQRDDQQLVGA